MIRDFCHLDFSWFSFPPEYIPWAPFWFFTWQRYICSSMFLTFSLQFAYFLQKCRIFLVGYMGPTHHLITAPSKLELLESSLGTVVVVIFSRRKAVTNLFWWQNRYQQHYSKGFVIGQQHQWRSWKIWVSGQFFLKHYTSRTQFAVAWLWKVLTQKATYSTTQISERTFSESRSIYIFSQLRKLQLSDLITQFTLLNPPY
jgi:hypothetical protein